mgnify:CR=1 FL=1
MARKKKPQPRVLPAALVRAGLMVLGGYLVLALIVNQVEISAKRQELAAVHAQLDSRLAQNEELARVLESGDELELIERVARDSLGYARPNERVFIEVSGR